MVAPMMIVALSDDLQDLLPHGADEGSDEGVRFEPLFAVKS